MYTNLVLSGGGIWGIALMGCINVLEKQPYFPLIKNFVGASVGSVIALFVTCGYSSMEMVDFIKEFLTDKKYTKIDYKNMLKFYTTCGLDDGNNLTMLLKLILTRKGYDAETTFLDLGKKTGKNLIVTGCNITTHTLEYFNIDTSPDMPVHLAVRISTCVPLLYAPVFYKNSYYVDACLYNNFPIDYFKREPSTTCGILLKEVNKNANPGKQKIFNVFNFVSQLVSSAMSHVVHSQIDEFKYKMWLYNIEVEGISIINWKTMCLNIDMETINKLYEIGRSQLEHQITVERDGDVNRRNVEVPH